MTSDCCPRVDAPSRLALKTKALLAVLFLLVVLMTHGGSRHAPFLFDDEGAIIDNPSIRDLSLSSLHTVLWGGEFTTVAGRPLLNLSLACNYAWGGLRPEGYHFANYVIHAAAAFVLFALLRRVLAQFIETRTAAVPLAVIISLLWCVHPLTINGVSYICQRAEAIASGFYLVVLWAFLKGVQTSQRRWFVLSVLAAWLGSLTKEIIATVPLTTIALDVLVVTRDWRMALRRHWGIYLCLLSSWVPLGASMWGSKSRAGTVGFGMGVTLAAHIQTQVWAIARYLWLSVWPHPLIFDYGERFVVSDLGQVLAATVVLVVFGIMVVWLVVRKSPWAFPGLTLCLLLAPTSVVPIATQTVAEHRMYLASACVMTAFVLGSYLIVARSTRLSAASPSTHSVIFGGVLAPVAILLFLTTARHTRVFVSPESVWADTVQKRPTNQRAIYNLAIAKFNRKTAADNDVAAKLCDEVIRMPGSYVADAYELRGMLCVLRGELQGALADFGQAITLRPKFIEYYHERAKILRDLRRYDDAFADLEKAKSIDPANTYTDLIQGSTYAVRGELTQALESYDRLLAQDPNHVAARRRRAWVYTRLNRWQDALREIQRLQHERQSIDEKLVRDVKQHLSSRQDVAM